MDKNSKRCFIVSMFSTLSAISLVSGFLVVEKNARNVIFREDPPFLSYRKNGFKIESIKIHFMGKDYALDF